jgi:hypothetical protein
MADIYVIRNGRKVNLREDNARLSVIKQKKDEQRAKDIQAIKEVQQEMRDKNLVDGANRTVLAFLNGLL